MCPNAPNIMATPAASCKLQVGDTTFLPEGLRDLLLEAHENPHQTRLDLTSFPLTSRNASGEPIVLDQRSAECVVRFLTRNPRFNALEMDFLRQTEGATKALGDFLKDAQKIRSLCFSTIHDYKATTAATTNSTSTCQESFFMRMMNLSKDLEANQSIVELCWNRQTFDSFHFSVLERVLSLQKVCTIKLHECSFQTLGMSCLTRALKAQSSALLDFSIFNCQFAQDQQGAEILHALQQHNTNLERTSVAFNRGLKESTLSALTDLIKNQRLPRLHSLHVNRNEGLFGDAAAQENFFKALCFHNDSLLHLQVGIEDAQKDYDFALMRKRSSQLHKCRLRNRCNSRVRNTLRSSQSLAVWAEGLGCLAKSGSESPDHFVSVSGIYLVVSTLAPKLAEQVSFRGAAGS